jgi:putative membrane protein
MFDHDVVDATRRTRLANERTYLAWLRTGLTALAVAAGVGKIVPGVAHVHRWPYEVLGVGFAIVGAACAAYGAVRFTRVERELAVGKYIPLEPRRAMVFAGATVLLGLVTLGLIFVH